MSEPAATQTPDKSPDELDLQHAYARLRRIAGRLMSAERAGHTLWPTELVHEAMARLLEADAERQNQGEPVLDLISRAARVMTQVLVDHARHRGAVKRGGGRGRVSLDEIGDVEAAIEAPHLNWAALDRALKVLEAQDPRRHSVVTLRFFGGLTYEQIARQLGCDERTVGRDWAAAQLWLKKRIQRDNEG